LSGKYQGIGLLSGKCQEKILSGKAVVFKEQSMYSSVFIDNLLHHSECVYTMSTYNNVHVACVQHGNIIRVGWVSAALMPEEWSP